MTFLAADIARSHEAQSRDATTQLAITCMRYNPTVFPCNPIAPDAAQASGHGPIKNLHCGAAPSFNHFLSHRFIKIGPGNFAEVLNLQT